MEFHRHRPKLSGSGGAVRLLQRASGRLSEAERDQKRLMMQVTYELHAQSKGRWSIERTWTGDSKETALDHARHLYAEPHISGVKVVCEKYNPETNESSETVVYDTTKKIGEKVKLKQQPSGRGKPRGPPTDRRPRRRQRAAPREKPRPRPKNHRR